MPFYGYLCEACGPFTALRAMAEFEKPSPCPSCGADAPRAVLQAPAIGGGSSARTGVFRADDAARPSLGRHTVGCACCLRR